MYITDIICIVRYDDANDRSNNILGGLILSNGITLCNGGNPKKIKIKIKTRKALSIILSLLHLQFFFIFYFLLFLSG